MTSCATDQATEVGCVIEHDAFPDGNKSPTELENEVNMEEEEDEEEDEEADVDFNPFLKESLSPQASSSLSSELVGGPEHVEEESANQTAISREEACERDKVCQKDGLRKTNKRKSVSLCESEVETIQVEDFDAKSSKIDASDGIIGELSKQSWKPKMDSDEEDAICRRTRARYSLASFTLDELEAFLQETDDDDDLQNVDDEEEYRKFLAAVLQGGDVDGRSTQENADIEDDDEDNDADFEIELEEMLESDYEEGTIVKSPGEEVAKAGRRPETRQNRRQKASVPYKKKSLEQVKRPLRPLVPILPNGPPIASIRSHDRNTLLPVTAPNTASSTAQGALINGFALHQIGQLHCLIHEHVQLLIQVFSLCILDPSRQHIASQVEGLIFEMLHKRDEVVACKRKPYPDLCFQRSSICSSVKGHSTAYSSLLSGSPGISPPPNIQGSVSTNISLSERGIRHDPDSNMGSSQTIQHFLWAPSTNDSVLSVLDVAPLNLVRRYMDDVYTAVQECRKRCVESSYDIHSGREPLFPFSCFSSAVEANIEVLKDITLPSADSVQSPPGQQPPKKSLAAALVESTKKQPVALVPKEISKLAVRFAPLFNPSFFPHKPPPVAVANRVLFTDAEDELLALGIMEYNTDWKAIQQRFLPCKSKHQIFVRQKNRCSSKAPENPIKAVRRMKTSPLTTEEIDRIQEGLKVFKLDWMSVWKFVVPYRDPTLLRRQWRIALGTQKSYKQDAARKEKRRLYELKRRCRTADLANWHLNSDKEGNNTTEENNSADVYVDNADAGNIDEAPSRISAPNPSSDLHCSSVKETHLPNCTLSQEGTQIGVKPSDYASREAQASSNNMPEFPSSLKDSLQQRPLSDLTGVNHCVSNTMPPNLAVSSSAPKTSKSQVYLPPYRARGNNNAQLVKLAPNLPPVNLPPTVRVISQSALKNGMFGTGQENVLPPVSIFSTLQTPCSTKTGRDKRISVRETFKNSNTEESAKDKSVEDDRGAESDLHLHPLLFQAPEDGRLPYYPLNSSTAFSSSFSFFSGNQPQLNLSLFHNPHQVNHLVDCLNKSLKTKESTSASCSIDFHPLLRRAEDANGLEGKSDRCQNHFNAVQNSVDLEMHLSSTSAREKAVGGAVMTASISNPMWSTITVAETRDTMETQNLNKEYYQHPGSVVANISSIGDPRDNSLPGIVMEQEELSDSDEESEEHVEFEHEEMADSEEEDGSGGEQIPEMHDKEERRPMIETVATDGDSDDDQHFEPRTQSHSLGTITPPSKSGLTNPGLETKTGSWLSLNSCSPNRPMDKKRMNSQEGPVLEDLRCSGNQGSSYPSRSCKKRTPPNSKKVAAPKQTLDGPQQLSLGPTGRAARKPRKRGPHTNMSNLNVAGSSTA